MEQSTQLSANAREEQYRNLYRLPRTLVNLPLEAHETIMLELGAVCSTCLGLTCHKLYDIHMEFYGVVGLDERYGGNTWAEYFKDVKFRGQKAPFFTLGEMLDMWARPDLKYELTATGQDWPTKFVKKPRFSYKFMVNGRRYGGDPYKVFTGIVVLSIPAGWEPEDRENSDVVMEEV